MPRPEEESGGTAAGTRLAGNWGAQLVVAAVVITDATLEKIVLMLVETPGRIAPAARATNPAIKAYSMRS